MQLAYIVIMQLDLAIGDRQLFYVSAASLVYREPIESVQVDRCALFSVNFFYHY